MVDSDLLQQLPRSYALALRLREAGVDDRLLADCLEIEPEAVGPLLRIAAAKLDHLKSGEGHPNNAQA